MRQEYKSIAISTTPYLIAVAYLAYPPQVGFTLQNSRDLLGLFVFASSIQIFITFLKLLYAKIKNRNFPKYVFIKPVIIIPVSLAGIFYLQSINQKAINYLWSTANIAQEICTSKNSCPENINGFVHKDSRHYQKYHVGKTLFHMYYQASGNTFNIYINYGLDSAYYLHGGTDLHVSHGWYDTAYNKATHDHG
jgi:hypothetical protein